MRSRYVFIIVAPLVFTVRASARILLFLPLMLAATAVPSFSAFAASWRIVFSCLRSVASLVSFSTRSVAACAAIARPITSPSFVSRFVSSAMRLLVSGPSQMPYARRSARASGRPASRISACVRSTG